MIYCFRCPKCGKAEESVRTIAQRHAPQPCPGCGLPMERDPRAELVGVRGEYKQPIISDSLGIHPDDIPEHRQKFPDIDITSDGRPILRSLAQKRSYLKRIGWRDARSYV